MKDWDFKENINSVCKFPNTEQVIRWYNAAVDTQQKLPGSK